MQNFAHVLEVLPVAHPCETGLSFSDPEKIKGKERKAQTKV